MGVVRGGRVRVRVVPRGQRTAVVVAGCRGRGDPRMDVPRPERALRQRARTGHTGERRGRVAPVRAARRHGARRPVCRAGQQVAVERPWLAQVGSRVDGGRRRPAAARGHARPEARVGGVRPVGRFQNGRQSTPGEWSEGSGDGER